MTDVFEMIARARMDGAEALDLSGMGLTELPAELLEWSVNV